MARVYWWFRNWPTNVSSLTFSLYKYADDGTTRTQIGSATASSSTTHGVINLAGVSAATLDAVYYSLRFAVDAMTVPQANVDADCSFYAQPLIRID